MAPPRVKRRGRRERRGTLAWRHVFQGCALLAVLMAQTTDARADREACLAAHEEGQELRVRGRFVAAREKLALCAASTCPKVISQDCASLLTDLEQTLPTIQFAVTTDDGTNLEDATIYADDTRLLQRLDGRKVPLDPGSHRIRVEAEGFAPQERQITVYAAEKDRVLRFELTRASAAETGTSATPPERAPPPRAHPVPVATYVLAGSALAVLGAGVGMGIAGKKELDRLESECDTRPCDRDDTKKGRSLYIAADAAFGVAGALAVAATWVYVAKLLDERQSPSPNAFGASVDGRSARLVFQRQF